MLDREENMTKYSTILFDADGTILDFEAAQRDALIKVFQNHNYTLDTEVKRIYEEINQGLWKQYEKGIISRDDVIYSRFAKLFETVGIEGDGISFEDEYQELLGQGHEIITGAVEVLESLSKTHDLYIVTNGVTKTQFSRLKASGLDKYMKAIFVSEETGYQKPMKEFFDYCFDRIPNLDRSKTIIIGDSLSSDILGGNNVGIDTCWFNPQHQVCDMEVKITYEIDELEKLCKIL
jgi:2-haloacid dehalogenase